MNGCNKCNRFANELKSLDGYTLLCRECEQAVLAQKEKIISNPPPLSFAIKVVWAWLMENTIPFLIERNQGEITVVCYGARPLLDVLEVVKHWSVVSPSNFSDWMVDFSNSNNDIGNKRKR